MSRFAKRVRHLGIPPTVSSDDDSQPNATETEGRFVAWVNDRGLFRPAGATIPQIPAGIYNLRVDNNGWFFEPTVFNADALLRLPGLPIDLILGQIETFWDQADVFTACGLLHKRGILLYGAAGTGKSSIIKLLSSSIVERDGIVLIITQPDRTEMWVQGLRQIEPERPVLTIIEDIDVHMKDEYSRSQMLAFLDGEAQVNHIVNLATTNYPDELDDTVAKRPGRFDLVIELKQPVREARETYLRSLLKAQVTEEQLQHLTDVTAGLGLAHLRELVVATHCLGLDLEETLTRLRGNMKGKLKPSRVGADDGLGYSIGFGRKE